MAADCLFCRIAAGDLPSIRIAESERAIAIMDINPATPGHALVLPRAHVVDIHDIGDADLCACALLSRAVADRALDRLGADGVTIMQSNGAAAWQTVFHYHVHVIPRYADDPLQLPWTPAPGDTEQIEATGRRYLDG